MKTALDELKTRARIRLNRMRREGVAGSLQLADCLHDAARAVGFAHWEHARHVLGGQARPGDDLGDFWHAPRTGILLHQWFAHYAEAVAVLDTDRTAYLLPYRRQCFIVQSSFIQALGLEPDDPHWGLLHHDLVAGLGTSAWQALAARRVRAPLETFAGR